MPGGTVLADPARQIWIRQWPRYGHIEVRTMEYLHNPYDEEELAQIRQGNHSDVPPHHMYEAVHSPASVTGYEYHVRQMGTQRVVAQRHTAEDAKQEAIRRAKNHRIDGVAFTRMDQESELNLGDA